MLSLSWRGQSWSLQAIRQSSRSPNFNESNKEFSMIARIFNLARTASVAMAVLSVGQMAMAAAVMPTFVGAPTGWSTDRYDPASFADVGTYQGRNNVLGIGINSTGDSASRPGGQQGTFYNTQGKQQAISGGAGSQLSADLYINSSWRSANNGFVRTDMWGVMSDATSAVSDYPIIGFTNFGAAGARLRAWDGDLNAGLGDWVNLTNAISYDAWNSFSIDFTGGAYDFYVNGVLAYHDTTTSASTGFSAVIMQAYNFADPTIPGCPFSTVDYVAHWSNPSDLRAVPEPGMIALVAVALLGLGTVRRRAAR